MQLAELRRGTALAWFDRYYQQQMVALLSKQRDEAALQIEAADAAYRTGRGAQADVFMARSGVARIEDRIRAAQAREANATTTLARWVGNSPPRRWANRRRSGRRGWRRTASSMSLPGTRTSP